MYSVICKPQRFPHWRIFEPHAHCFDHALNELGKYAEDRQIVFGAHLLPDGYELAKDAIIYNMEVYGVSGCFTPGFLKRLGRHEVWDYSQSNIDRGIKAKHVPIGWSPVMRFVQKEKDIDVVFCGSLNERRLEAMRAIQKAGLQVVHVFGIYGQEFDEIRARARINVDIKWHPDVPRDVGRLCQLWANELPEVCEDDIALDQMPDKCVDMIKNWDQTMAQAREKRINFEKISQTEILRSILV